MKRLFKSVGLPEVRAHNLRHTLGKRLADAGVHIRTIQDILGHADSSTVEIYTPTTRSDISTALEKTNSPHTHTANLNYPPSATDAAKK